MDQWNPQQYNQFQTERAQPFWDLAGKLDFSQVGYLLDIGCGTGETTQALHLKNQVPRTLGIDSSAKMLEQATGFKDEGLAFQIAKVEEFQPTQKFDAVISNAALQWVDNHQTLLPQIFSWLVPGGQIAIQMPVNFDHPSHLLADQLAKQWGLAVRGTPVLAPEAYAQLFHRFGFTAIDISVKVYLHPMKSVSAIAEWTKGTLLTHFQKQLSPADYQKFFKEYVALLISHQGGDEPCLYTFKRVFLVATSAKKLE